MFYDATSYYARDFPGNTEMPATTATVAYKKKKNGILAVSEDVKYVFFTPSDAPSGSSPTLTVPVADITNLQQTPATAANIALKLVVGADSHVFTFKHPQRAREEQVETTAPLREALAIIKARENALPVAGSSASGAGTPAPSGDNGGQSAAMAIAKAVSSNKADDAWYDDAKLKADIKLQKSLIDSNPALSDRFNQALKDKPESLSITQFTAQFWSARLHLLRAHAIELAQKQGEYNVLPTIGYETKPAEKPGEPDTKTFKITKEQIKLMFKQYPVIKEAYDESVPPLTPTQFWTQLFAPSRLLKKLRGEKVMQNDPRNPVLDKFLDRPESGVMTMTHVPHWMDLEGNEQDHSQRKGNRADQEMRPSGNEKVPILRVLNNLSEKMMSHISTEDGEAHGPIGVDEETYEQLRIQDLVRQDVDNRLVLNVKKQQVYTGGRMEDLSIQARLFAQQDPEQVLSSIRDDMQPSHLGSDKRGTLKLDRVLGYHTDDDSDSDDDTSPHTNGSTTKQKPTIRVGSHKGLALATNNLLSSVRQARRATSGDPHFLNGLSQKTFDTLTMTHDTTTEFLHYFWTVFLSGDASRTRELEQLVATLDRSIDRINAVGDEAEKELQARIADVKREDQIYYERSKKRRRRNFEEYPGGKKAVDAMVGPTRAALGRAVEAYARERDRQMKENAAATGV
ncbi:General transcription and DNA repair factor IIH subunit tcf-29 [Fulvia fulva]|uniref:General transcription and DNA repair factor IIH subunit tcf-29 n=1 Tax=Passalora fulva TaxID=5499 RepID=A0A9Q8LIC4_PASFU|nr:General transcription and DNA repair factor IIH subunit tcf-29 [Fulvia fulva]KAK4624227.1 General transcription and DNA repair factor IIH subunit tcf-29 [Fulvia fulva]UJO17679.1 General transcription and DNA repair factor IIH subunit tcf-29 [Fulvia fulva]WPV15651.1 General transcription and DNA repair factor IIH subunit tcf-29 [Fulvia fulva]WPV29695.1 General transcription and DNA repair factor IIH subunit tcf-29 [Fulvia fulva]